MQTLTKDFPITTNLTYDDLINEGYDIAKVTDETMEELADDMMDSFMYLYWETLNVLTEKYNIKKHESKRN